MDQDLYFTADMGLTAYLLYMGHRYTDLFWEDSQCRWGFEDPGGVVSGVAEQWYKDEVRVEPRKFLSHFRDVKKQVYYMAPPR